MRSHRSRLSIALVLSLILCLAAGGAADAKKKRKKHQGPATLDITKVVNQPIPDATAGGAIGVLTSTIDVGAETNGRVIRDVNVTLQTLGTSGNFPAFGLIAGLRAPNGTWVTLFTLLQGFGPTEMSIGPLTLDDEAFFDLGGGNPTNPGRLYSPWQGSATPGDPVVPNLPQRYYLSDMDGGPVTGAWQLVVYDFAASQTSNLVSWNLHVTHGRPFRSR